MNRSQQKRPSPDWQNIVYSSHLKGMERPVRSFKSFIRSSPSYAITDKPLPPIPQLQKHPSSSYIPTSGAWSTGFSLWRSPSDWDNGDGSQAQSTPSFAARYYSPLLPEPPEDLAAMQADTTLWQVDNGPFRQTLLDPIHEKVTEVPDLPPRNPSRRSLLLSIPSPPRNDSTGSLLSISSQYSTVTPQGNTQGVRSRVPSVEELDSVLPSPLDLASALSDMTMKERAFASLGLGSPRDQGIVWGFQAQRSDSVQLDASAHPDLQTDEFNTSKGEDDQVDKIAPRSEDINTSHNLHDPSFIQDYQYLVIDQDVGNCTQSVEDSRSKTPPHDQGLTPQPLAWRKQSSSSAPTEPFQDPQMVHLSSPQPQSNLRKMSSWVGHHLKINSQPGPCYRSVSAPETPSQSQLSGSEVQSRLRKAASMANIIQRGKNLVHRRVQRRESEPKDPIVISSLMPQHPTQFPESCPFPEAPFQLATPLLRLPGGFAIVRQSPMTTPRPHTAGEQGTPMVPDASCIDLPTSSSNRLDHSRRGSWHSEQSKPSVTLTAAVIPTLRSLIKSPMSLRSFSCSSPSLATLVPQETPSTHFTPPAPRRRSHNVGSPLTSPPVCSIEERTESSVEQTSYKLNLFEKARVAREAWRTHQKEAKNEKLKQSIRLMGPADASGVAGYIKCDGRPSGDSGIGESRLLGHTIKSTT
jgi:hypothetical protein